MHLVHPNLRSPRCEHSGISLVRLSACLMVMFKFVASASVDAWSGGKGLGISESMPERL